MIPRRRSGGGVLLVSVLSCGGEPTSQPFDIQLPQPQVLVSTESALLGEPSDIALDPEGRLWIADAVNKRVVLLDHDGSVIRTIGRSGEGPGEFQFPSNVAVNDTILRVWDPLRFSIQDYRPDGTHLADHAIQVQLIGASALSVDGSLVLPTFGRDSALAALHTVASSTIIRLGPVVVSGLPTSSLFALSNLIKEEAKKGRVPEEVRNFGVAPAFGPHGTIWLLVQTEHEVRKYSPDGALLWRRTLDVPEVEASLQAFFRRTAELEPSAPAFPPLTLDAAREVGGTVWILTHGEAGDPSAFYLLDSKTGQVQGRLSVETTAPARRFIVDPQRKRLYLAIPEEAAIASVDLRSVTELSWE